MIREFSIRCAPPLTLLATLVAAPASPRRALPDVRVNPNTERAGVLRNGVLTVALDAEQSLWRFNGNQPPMSIDAFAERGKPPRMPAPFIRVPAGTQIQLSIRNSLPRPLTFIVPAAMHGGPDRVNAMDSVVVASNAVGTLTTRAALPGNYVYRGKTTDGASRVSNIGGMLAGAIVVDSAGVTSARDRVLVIMATEDSISAACDDTTTVNPRSECPGRRFMYTINGTEWPNTDRVHATVGDSLRWRVVNASAQVHPMHLHGFYFRVDDLSGPFADEQGRPAPGQLVVTQLLQPLGAMSMTWSPDRPGNWLFHCHFALHNTPYALMHMPDDSEMRDMVGLVVGVLVAPRAGVVAAGHPTTARRLRLVAERSDIEISNGGTRNKADSLPSMRFVLEENGRRTDTHSDVSPELDLVRGEPVAITIVNHLDEPTSVHWHGVEVEDSYADGAAGFSGEGKHLAPAIAPGDSFVARFTPPRSGTFMYHSHLDEMREELAGLAGVLVVRDSAGAPAGDDHAFLFKGLGSDRNHPLEINGKASPDTVVLRAGHPARIRLLNLSTTNNTAAPAFWLTARADSAIQIAKDTMLVQWTPTAKDAFDLPVSARASRRAEQIVSVGETFDFEYTPEHRGILRLEIRAANAPHRLLIRVPVRVE